MRRKRNDAMSDREPNGKEKIATSTISCCTINHGTDVPPAPARGAATPLRALATLTRLRVLAVLQVLRTVTGERERPSDPMHDPRHVDRSRRCSNHY
eukprot:6373298-Prymnesium_polylepis.1